MENGEIVTWLMTPDIKSVKPGTLLDDHVGLHILYDLVMLSLHQYIPDMFITLSSPRLVNK